MNHPFLPWPPVNLRRLGDQLAEAFRRPNDGRTNDDRRLEFPFGHAGYQRLTPADLTGAEPLWITRKALTSISLTVGARRAEEGSLLGGRRTRGVITHTHFDTTANRSAITYSPDVTEVNRVLAEDWNPAGIDFLGFVHSHPAGNTRPSSGDLAYAHNILNHMRQVDRLVMPIVQTRPDTGRFGFHPYTVVRARGGGELQDVGLRVLDDPTVPTLHDPAFDRVRDAYDLKAMAGLRLVLVGVGGAAEAAESLARAGVGEFVLIDPDVIEAANVGTQQVYRRDIGRPKIDAVAERILDVNPHARVIGVQALLDNLTDDMVRRLVHRPFPHASATSPGATILCGFTDSFLAQARVNRLALHLGVPMVAAQVYQRGMGVEMSFHVPGKSVACGRCVLGGRYRAQLEGPELIEITSHGTPLWATQRLNEIKSMIILSVAHGIIPGDDDHPGRQRYETLLERIANRNLVQVRLDPDAPLPAFTKAFANADQDRIVTDETLWLPQEPENPATGFPACADCGGTGDLTDAIGNIPNSHLLTKRAERPDRPLRAVPA